MMRWNHREAVHVESWRSANVLLAGVGKDPFERFDSCRESSP